MKIGCVKEIKVQEYRVGLTPDNAAQYISHSHTVSIEKDAGLGSGFTDEQYEKVGVKIFDDAKSVWENSDMLIKVKEPLESEYKHIQNNQILYTYLHLAADRDLTYALLESGCKGVAYETIVDKKGLLPCLKPMSEIAGRLSVQEGAKYLEKPFGGKGLLLGGVPGVKNAKVVIIGAGYVGMNALRMAVGLGADVTIMDVSLDKLTYLDELYFNKIKTVYSTPSAVEKEISDADLVIGAVLLPGASAPKVVKKQYLQHMPKGSVMVDVAVDQGGCFETTKVTYHDDPIYEVDGIVHYCVGNMPGAVPYTSTLALTNTTLKYGLMIADMGLEEACARDGGLKKGINIYNGGCTYKSVAECYGLDYMPLDF